MLLPTTMRRNTTLISFMRSIAGRVLRFGLVVIRPFTLQKMSVKRGYLHRGLAILFLGLILTDLMLPQLCCDELGRVCGDEALVSAVAARAEVTVADYQGKQRSESPPVEKGCFCCCANILQSRGFIAGIVAVNVDPNNLTVCLLPSSPPQDTFHPPRFA